jgi:hypothetical protein
METFTDCFEKSRSRERLKERFGQYLFWTIALAATGIYLWRCHFGIDLTDEAFYSVPAWKMFSLGDRPFTDEIFNGMRHSDLLNFLFVRPFVSFSILEIRQSAVLCYSLILLAFALRCFRKNIGLTAGLVFATCLTYDYFLMPTWSYNWWARNFILLHHLFLMDWNGKRASSSSNNPILIGAAGACMGVIIVAYNSLLPALPITAAVFFISGRFRNCRSTLFTVVIPYLLGGALIIGLDLGFILSSSLQSDWLISIHSMSAMTEYSKGFALEKAWNVLSFIFSSPSAPLLLLTIILAYADSDWMNWLGTLRTVFIKREKTCIGISILCLLSVVLLTRGVEVPEKILSGYVALGVVAAVIMGFTFWNEENSGGLSMVVSSVLVALGIALSSTNQHLALFWAMPSLIIPFVARELSEAEMRSRGVNFFWRIREGMGHGTILLFILFLAAGTLQYQRLHTYYDVPPGNCSTEVNVSPLTGLKTSPRRAFLIQELSRLVGDRDFVMSFAETPGTLLFGQARSAVDTTMVEQGAPRETNLRSLQRMVERGRFPSLAIRAKIRPWYWGIHHPLSHSPLTYPANDPYSQLVECAKSETLVDYEEFSAYEIDRAKIAGCVSQIETTPLAETTPWPQKIHPEGEEHAVSRL